MQAGQDFQPAPPKPHTNKNKQIFNEVCGGVWCAGGARWAWMVRGVLGRWEVRGERWEVRGERWAVRGEHWVVSLSKRWAVSGMILVSSRQKNMTSRKHSVIPIVGGRWYVEWEHFQDSWQLKRTNSNSYNYSCKKQICGGDPRRPPCRCAELLPACQGCRTWRKQK